MEWSPGGDDQQRKDVKGMQAVVEAVLGEEPASNVVDVKRRGPHSNDVFEVGFADGRVLMVKRARHAWARKRFAASREAAGILREMPGVEVPRPLPSGGDPEAPAIQAYWRISHPTLADLWPDLDAHGRRAAMRSWGCLLAKVHEIELDGWGRLGPADEPVGSLAEALEEDLEGRLIPALWGTWPDAAPLVERLAEWSPHVARLVDGRTPTLAHGDLHMGNVLCRADEAGVRCTGLLDLDDAAGAPPESDMARLEVLHGPLFEQHVSPRWRAEVWRGYGRAFLPRAVSFYRALHLANLGFASALVGHDVHAADVARALKGEVERLQRSHPEGWRDERERRASGALPGSRRHAGVLAWGRAPSGVRGAVLSPLGA